MISKDILIKTIIHFDNKRKQLDKDFENETDKSWTFEKFQEWEKYQNAWRKLQDVVECEILPLTQ